MSYETDPYYNTARNFVKKFSENFEKDEGYNKTFASTSLEKTGIAQRNTIITLLIQVLQKLEKLESIFLDIPRVDTNLDIEKLTDKLSQTLKVSTYPSKPKKKKSQDTFFLYKPENLK